MSCSPRSVPVMTVVRSAIRPGSPVMGVGTDQSLADPLREAMATTGRPARNAAASISIATRESRANRAARWPHPRAGRSPIGRE